MEVAKLAHSENLRPVGLCRVLIIFMPYLWQGPNPQANLFLHLKPSTLWVSKVTKISLRFAKIDSHLTKQTVLRKCFSLAKYSKVMVLDGQFSRAEKVSVPAIVETTALSNDDWPPEWRVRSIRIVSSPHTVQQLMRRCRWKTSKGFPLVSRDAGFGAALWPGRLGPMSLPWGIRDRDRMPNRAALNSCLPPA